MIYVYYIRSRPDIKFRSFRAVIDFLRQNWRSVCITHEDDFIVVRENLRTGTRVMFEQSFAKIADVINN